MRVLSCFDWISVGYQALKNIWVKDVEYYASEIDKYAIQIAKKNHPDIIHIGDIVNVKWWDYDLIIWWSPCQGFSNQGKRLNFEDPRSKLFFEFVRIVKESKPRYFMLENVKMKKEWVDIITSYLFDIEPVLINSSKFTAQNRERLYWIGELQDDWSYKRVKIWEIKDRGIKFEEIYKKWDKSNISDKAIQYALNAKFKSDRVIKLPKDKANTLLAWSRKTYEYNWVYRKLTPEEMEILQGLPVWYTEWVSNTQRYKMLGNAWTLPVIEFIFKHFKF